MADERRLGSSASQQYLMSDIRWRDQIAQSQRFREVTPGRRHLDEMHVMTSVAAPSQPKRVCVWLTTPS